MSSRLKRSFTNGIGAFPSKILQDVELVRSIVEDRRVLLRHLHLCPTNRCDLSCSFCAYRDRDLSAELPYDKIVEALECAYSLGCRAVTISGGGEPLLHPRIADVVAVCTQLGIGVGIVTNGLRIAQLPTGVAWCRVSLSPERNLDETLLELADVVTSRPDVGWGFNYVLSVNALPLPTPSLNTLLQDVSQLVTFAREYNFTHVKIASDVYDSSPLLMNAVRRIPRDDRVVFWSRGDGTPGAKQCWVSLMRPVLAADGRILPCCAVQHAVESVTKDFCCDMGKSFERVWSGQQYFDGAKCVHCYYSRHNEVLQALMEKVEYSAWV